MPSAIPLQTEDAKYSSDKYGVRRVDITYHIDGPPDHEGAEPWELIDRWLPSKAPMNLPAVDRNAQKQVDGSWALIISFQGVAGSGRTGADVEIDYESVESAIELHPKFAALKEKYKAVMDPDNQARLLGWQPKIPSAGAGSSSVPNPFFGISHYLLVNPIVRVSFVLPKFDPGILKGMCKRGQPIVPTAMIPGLDQLGVSDGGEALSWLKYSATAQWCGNAWKFTLQYKLGKWAEDIYANDVDNVGANFRSSVDGSGQAANLAVGDIA